MREIDLRFGKLSAIRVQLDGGEISSVEAFSSEHPVAQSQISFAPCSAAALRDFALEILDALPETQETDR